MKSLKLLIGMFLLACLGCTGCGANLANTPPETVRAEIRAAVTVAKDAWMIVATTCVNAADATGDESIRTQCAKYLVPARTIIITAAQAVDSGWNTQVACDLSIGVDLIARAAADLRVDAKILVIVQDAATLAKMVAGPACVGGPPADDAGAPITRTSVMCHRDGGSSCFN
jgi:hypothetical protein